MRKWITFDISDGTSNKDASRGLLLCSYGALLCVQCVWGLQGHEHLQGGGGVVDENGGMGARQKVPTYSEYMAVYFPVYGRILRSIRQEYFSNTSSILPNTSKSVDCHTQVWVYGIGFLVF